MVQRIKMATLRQKRLAKVLVLNNTANKPLNAGELLESVGYAKSVAEAKPTEIIQQKGVQQELAKLGFDPETAKSVVAEILIAGTEDSSRLKAADMVFKVHGSYAAEKHINLNIDVESTEHSRELGNRLLGLLRR